jgi:TATA-box binding protein (TBP) (component of TFIID and TFIIIB)
MDIHKAVTIYNMCGVFSASVSTIDLSLLAVKMSNSSYNAKKIPALVIRKTNPKATILLFRTGKAIILGT